MRPPPLRPVPGSAPAAGVAILRGEVAPVVALRALLGVEPARTPEPRLVTLWCAGRRLGLLVDEVRGVRELPEGALAPLPTLVEIGAGALFEGMTASGDGLLLLFDAVRVLPQSLWDGLEPDRGEDPSHAPRPADA